MRKKEGKRLPMDDPRAAFANLTLKRM